MSLFLLPYPQMDAILLAGKETQRRSSRKNLDYDETMQLREHIENQIRKQKEITGVFRGESTQAFDWHMNVGSIGDKCKIVLGLKMSKLKKSIQMRIFFSTISGTLFRVHNKNKYTQITRSLQFRSDANHAKIMNICLNVANGQLVSHFPVTYFFNQFLQPNLARAQSRIFKLFKDNIQQVFPILEKLMMNTNQEVPFGLQESSMKKKIWENIYRYEQMMGISSHLNESYIQTEQQIMQKDKIKAVDIKRTMKNRHVLPSWVLRNSFLFQECMLLDNCLPQSENSFYLAHEQLQFIRSMISMPVQPRSRHPCENNLILNHIYVHNINNVHLNKVNQGGFSQIFLAEIDYCYVFSSEGHEVLYEETNDQRQNNVLHKYVIVKKEAELNKSNRLSHELKVLKHIKNGLSIFLPKYYIVVNKSSILSDSIIMDFIPFKSLRDYMKSNSASMSLNTKLYLIFSIIQSLRYIRDFRIVHLDLKPNNIMIFCNLLIKLIDFGESYHPEVCADKHNPGFTVPYSPPEVHSRSAKFTSKSDVFSLGVIMFQILYNCRPFEIFDETKDLDDSMSNYLFKWYFAPEELEASGESQIMRIFNFIISRCLSPRPKDRPELDWIALITRQCLEICNS